MCDPRRLFEDARDNGSTLSFKQLEVYVQERPYDHEAMCHLGDCYLYKYGSGYEAQKAFECYSKASKGGYHLAYARLGLMYWQGYHVKKNAALAATNYYHAATKNYDNSYYSSLQQIVKENPECGYATYILGLCEEYGHSCWGSVHAAKRNYEIASKLDHACGFYGLAELYYQGKGVSKNHKEAAKNFLAAAKRNSKEALDRLQLLCATDQTGIFITALGEYHLFKKDYKKAFENFDSAVKKKFSPAMIKLGEMYVNGEGVDKNAAKAHALYIDAAKANDPDAVPALEKLLAEVVPQNRAVLTDIGSCYAQGLGVSVDNSAAHKNFEKAMELGCTFAKLQVAQDYHYAMGIQRDIPKSVALMYQLARSNAKESQQAFGRLWTWSFNYNLNFELGACYFYGAGVAQDYQVAINCFKRTEDDRALTALGIAYEEGKGVEKNLQEALAYYLKAAKANGQFDEGSKVAIERLVKLTSVVNPNPMVLHVLAECYENGYTLPMDPGMAAKHYQQEIDVLYTNLLEGSLNAYQIPETILAIKKLTQSLFNNLVKALKTQRDDLKIKADPTQSAKLNDLTFLVTTIQTIMNSQAAIKTFMYDGLLLQALSRIDSFESQCLASIFDRERQFHRYLTEKVDPKLQEIKAQINNPEKKWQKKFLFIWVNQKPQGIAAIDEHLKKSDQCSDEEKLTHYAAITKIFFDKQSALTRRHDSSKDFYKKNMEDLQSYNFNNDYRTSTKKMVQVLKPVIPSAPPLEQPSIFEPVKDFIHNLTAAPVPPITAPIADLYLIPTVAVPEVSNIITTTTPVKRPATPIFFPPVCKAELPTPKPDAVKKELPVATPA